MKKRLIEYDLTLTDISKSWPAKNIRHDHPSICFEGDS